MTSTFYQHEVNEPKGGEQSPHTTNYFIKHMQVRNSFDNETLKKIGRGMLIAFSGAGVIGLLQFIGTIETNSPILTPLIALIVPMAVNAVREYTKGE